MRSNDRHEIVEVFDALEADIKRALDLRFDILTTPERLALLQRCERLRRQLPAIEHPLINQVSEQADEANHPQAQAYYQRKRSEGKSRREAMRCLKRRLSDLIYRQLIHDADRKEADPGGHSGAALSSRAAG